MTNTTAPATCHCAALYLASSIHENGCPAAARPTARVYWSAPGVPVRSTVVALWHPRKAGHDDETGARRILAIRYLDGLDAVDTIRIHAMDVSENN